MAGLGLVVEDHRSAGLEGRAFVTVQPPQADDPPGRAFSGGQAAVAEHADAWNLAWTQTPEQLGEKLGILEEHCSEVGRDIGEIERTLGIIVVLGEDEEQIRGKVKEMLREWGSELNVDQYLERLKGALVGTPEQIIDSLKEYMKLGVDHFILMFPDVREVTPLAYFATEVISNL